MNEVPLLIYPFLKESDWGGNSARVVYQGIGSRGFIEKETEQNKRQTIFKCSKSLTIRKKRGKSIFY